MPTIARSPCDEAVILTGAAARADDRQGRWVLVVAILGSSMAFIDGTVVNVALPALQVAFDASLADVQWVVESYALTLAALLLTGGALGDARGRRTRPEECQQDVPDNASGSAMPCAAAPRMRRHAVHQHPSTVPGFRNVSLSRRRKSACCKTGSLKTRQRSAAAGADTRGGQEIVWREESCESGYREKSRLPFPSRVLERQTGDRDQKCLPHLRHLAV
jgi:hypothetical protein